MSEGKERAHISGLILNSPFLVFKISKTKKTFGLLGAKLACKVSQYSKIDSRLSPVYPKSLHKDYYGSWNFNFKWKPLKGFPTYYKWILSIDRAQRSLKKSKIDVPILVMHSSGSLITEKFSNEVMTHDIVLNVEDMKRVGKKLGTQVTFMEITNAQHDIFLSPKPVRDNGFEKMFCWLSNSFFERTD